MIVANTNLASRLKTTFRAKIDRFLSTFTLVSRIPLKTKFAVDYTRTDFWLPLIGPFASLAAIVGLAIGASVFRDGMLASISSIFAQYAAFNLFHFDGLLDSADATLPYTTREKRMEILKDPRIGSFAFFAGFLLLLTRIVALARLCPEGRLDFAIVAALLTAPAAGRAAAALVPCMVKPARETGLGALMKGFSLHRVALGLAVAIIPLPLWIVVSKTFSIMPQAVLIATLCAAPAAAVIAGLLVSAVYKKTLGGFTGDALGAAVEIGELIAILIVSALLSPTGFQL